MAFMIDCLVTSGYLKSSADLRDHLRHALRVCIRVPSLLSHFESELQRAHRVPSSTALYRHRLRVHIGLCRLLADVHAEVLKGPIMRRGTLDSSPQGSMDWLLAGATVMTTADTLQTLSDARRLIELGRAEVSEQSIAEQHAMVSRTEPRLRIEQGTPTGLGSGRSSLVYKVHALAHSVRLCSADWPDACALLRGTLTWTADMGTESGIANFHGNAATLFPSWADGHPDVEDGQLGGPQAVGEEGACIGMAAFSVDGVGPEPGGFDFMPAQPQAEADQHVPAPDQHEDYPGPPHALDVDLRSSIYISGVLHTVHSVTEGLTTSLEFFDDFTTLLTHV